MSELPVIEERAERCETCRFWSSAHGGECRRRAPEQIRDMTRVHEPDQALGPMVSAVECLIRHPVLFPPTGPDGWCGEWKAKARAEGDGAG